MGKSGGLNPTPSPSPLETRDGRGLCKMCLQNLEPQGVRGQNLENKEFGGATFSRSHGVAVSRMSWFLQGAQGQMSHAQLLVCGKPLNFFATDLRGSSRIRTSRILVLDPWDPRESVAKKFAYGTLNLCTSSRLATLNSAFFGRNLSSRWRRLFRRDPENHVVAENGG